MIRALLVIWYLDPSGAGTAAVLDMPSMDVCEMRVADAKARGSIASGAECLPNYQAARVVGELFNHGCATNPTDGPAYVCTGRAPKWTR